MVYSQYIISIVVRVIYRRFILFVFSSCRCSVLPAFRSKYSPEGQVERKIIIVVTLRRPYDPAAAVSEKSTSAVV